MSGGVHLSVLHNCLVAHNHAQGDGGGGYSSTFRDCRILHNTAERSGGGVALSTVYRSTIAGNNAAGGAGGMMAGRAFSTLIASNTAGTRGGGVDRAFLNNCTVVANTAGESGGGIQWGYATNSIIWGNNAPWGANHEQAGGRIHYSCTTPLPGFGAIGNISDDPRFVDPAAGDYRLQSRSPCIDRGQYAVWMDDEFDLDGNPRVIGSAVDLGAYEHENPSPPRRESIITVTVSDAGAEMGRLGHWQASLYAGAVIGQERDGRFTAWEDVGDGIVHFRLPGAILEDHEAPWGIPDDTYVRVRSVAGDYPEFDWVSDAFSLDGDHYAVHFALRGENASEPVETVSKEAHVTARWTDAGEAFGRPGAWEASLYAGALAGEETQGRFTAWVAAEDGEVTFVLPDDASEGETPWGDLAYIRVRPVDRGDDYPQYDVTGGPFLLEQGRAMVSRIGLSRLATRQDATITVMMEDAGLEFGAIEGAEASLYAGAVPGGETSGRFTDWFEIEDGIVVFVLPDVIREGVDAPWAIPEDTYVRIRSLGEAYPSFDLVSDPFTLLATRHIAAFRRRAVLDVAESGVAAGATVAAVLADHGGVFGKPGAWEASLYAGALAGEETQGRFTAWVAAEDGEVTFVLPDHASEGETPWGDLAYIRVRPVDREDDYPQFDFTGAPFVLMEGNEITSVLHLERGAWHADGSVRITVSDMGLDFGTIREWEASLYEGAEPGEERSGRFTAWKSAENGSVVFLLPGETRDGRSTPWCVEEQTYVRLRTKGDYPVLDMVSAPFTLCRYDYDIHFSFGGTTREAPAPDVPEAALVTILLEDPASAFGLPGDWEVALYAGARADEEQEGRLTGWVGAEGGAAQFTLPDDASGGEAPWGGLIYARFRPVDRENAYPQFDLVGRPFLLQQGMQYENALQQGRTGELNPDPSFHGISSIELRDGAIWMEMPASRHDRIYFIKYTDDLLEGEWFGEVSKPGTNRRMSFRVRPGDDTPARFYQGGVSLP